ncbi:MAG: YidC/Oxa1 family membrane protein insertase [Actinomycetota bacterium]|nr:YidC/Oxa1 family membrane protein insertase [Actinomycetota bacterium]MDQ3719674.1 YidC/Oxa1 family membrane protein insertase [Actinomycetota bacterium]
MFPIAESPQWMQDILGPLVDASRAILVFWEGLVGSWGLAIILMTFTIRLAILPLTFKGVKSMQRLQQLQPEMKRLQERYKDDRQRMNQELMKFYQEQKVNPLGSCFPLLLQIPFFMALFVLLQDKDFEELGGDEKFLFIPNLAESLTGNIPVLAIMVVLYIGTQLASTAVTAISADPMQRKIMFALPFVFTIFIINFPAGLLVYWITTNTWTIGQQLLVKKLYPKPEPIEPADDDKPTPARGKPPAEKKPAVTDDGKDGKSEGRPATRKRPAAAKAAASGNGAGGNGKTSKPPTSPRKKRKRSGRRR